MNQKYRIIVAGGRDFDDYFLVKKTLDEYLTDLRLDNPDFHYYCDVEIVSGRARGADRLGEQYANSLNIRVACFEANWQKYGKVAGPMRNAEMAKYASEEGYTGVLIAFWDGESRGTEHMIKVAERKGLEIKVVRYEKK